MSRRLEFVRRRRRGEVEHRKRAQKRNLELDHRLDERAIAHRRSRVAVREKAREKARVAQRDPPREEIGRGLGGGLVACSECANDAIALRTTSTVSGGRSPSMSASIRSTERSQPARTSSPWG